MEGKGRGLMVFAVMGGDERQARLAAQLAEDGHEVRVFALEVAALPEEIRHHDTAAEAAEGADCVVLPLPLSIKKGYLNAPLASRTHCLGEALGALAFGQTACAGMPDAAAYGMAAKRGAVLCDYFRREELLAANATATAEGALAVIIGETSFTLCGSRVLVIGRGRLGRAIAPRLNALGAEVTVASRREGDMAWTRSEGMAALDSRRMEGALGAFDVVVNTVPALMLTAQLLEELSPDALVVDLASRPGGVDLDAARMLGARVVPAMSLPGRYAPDTAARAVKEAVYNIIKELESEDGT